MNKNELIEQLLRYIDTNAMDRLVEKDGEIIGWEKTQKFCELIDSVRKANNRPTVARGLDREKVMEWIKDNSVPAECAKNIAVNASNALIAAINSGNLNVDGESG